MEARESAIVNKQVYIPPEIESAWFTSAEGQVEDNMSVPNTFCLPPGTVIEVVEATNTTDPYLLATLPNGAVHEGFLNWKGLINSLPDYIPRAGLDYSSQRLEEIYERHLDILAGFWLTENPERAFRRSDNIEQYREMLTRAVQYWQTAELAVIAKIFGEDSDDFRRMTNFLLLERDRLLSGESVARSFSLQQASDDDAKSVPSLAQDVIELVKEGFVRVFLT